MNKKNNYNSIVFLTTLSVYLGLVLVGATPSILAQAALTRDFDIKNEIVFEEDLDKKPDDERIDIADSLESYFDDVESFIKDLQKLHRVGNFNLDFDKFDLSRELSINCKDYRLKKTDLIWKIDNSFLELALKDSSLVFSRWTSLSDCLIKEKTDNQTSINSKLKLFYDNTELNIEISTLKLTKQRADFLAEKFNQASKIYEIDEENNFVKKIHENTSFKSENNQVFIVTRLPRGSLDALLTTKDAQ